MDKWEGIQMVRRRDLNQRAFPTELHVLPRLDPKLLHFLLIKGKRPLTDRWALGQPASQTLGFPLPGRRGSWVSHQPDGLKLKLKWRKCGTSHLLLLELRGQRSTWRPLSGLDYCTSDNNCWLVLSDLLPRVVRTWFCSCYTPHLTCIVAMAPHQSVICLKNTTEQQHCKSCSSTFIIPSVTSDGVESM